MRAKRSKKYRKIMSAYAQTFSFREPYQVLLDAAFIRKCHAFKMPLQRSLENTLQGQCRIFATKCTLSKIMRDWEEQSRKEEKSKSDGASGRRVGRPGWLPPPTELPLRHCKHNEEGSTIEEWRCLVDLCAGQPKGNEQAKNKQHFVLATAEAAEEERRNAGTRFVDARERVRQVPGVPVVYVKRSVMVLEELSGASEAFRRGVEREKLRVGQTTNRKRKRGDEEDDQRNEHEGLVHEPGHGEDVDQQSGPQRRGMRKAKGPNPLSVRKKRAKPSTTGEQVQADVQYLGPGVNAAPAPKARRRRKHGPKGDVIEAIHRENMEVTAVENILAAHSRLQDVLD